MKTLWDSPKYKKFTRDRNQALEQILNHTQTDISRMLFEALDKITGFVSHMAIQDEMSQLDQYLEMQFHPLILQMTKRVARMRKNAYLLTYLGELEAVARATQKTKSLNSMDFQQNIQSQMSTPTILGQDVSKRIWMALENLRHKILKAFKSAILQDKSPKEVVDDVKASYPQVIAYPSPPRALKPIREADQDPDQEFQFYSGLTHSDDWDKMVQAYQSTELPPTRFDQQAQGDQPRYDWEMEQEVTDDFVSQVRDGQVDAASDLGIKDFVWVSVIDKRTCEVCCLPRNGKTTREIEKMLSSGELNKDECDATTPPAHPHCRCDLAPVGDVSEVPGTNWKEFSDWLNS